MISSETVRAVAGAALAERDLDRKVAMVASLELGNTGVIARPPSVMNVSHPGRPDRPKLVSFRQLPRRGFHTPALRAAVLHSVVHIEANAINLALDAVHRFDELPWEYYRDWCDVAREEARHFVMLRSRLRDLDYEYGDFDAHDGLWSMAQSTATDLTARMALVPRFLEARGIDVAPSMIERFAHHGDGETAALLQVILEDEIGHVAIGSRWFQFACDQQGLCATEVFHALLKRHRLSLNPPINVDARLLAGFDLSEMTLGAE